MQNRTQPDNDLQAKLSHILWIGGGTDAGKTTVAEALVERHGLQYYNFDRNERSHFERRRAAGDFINKRWIYDMTPDEMWIDQTPEETARGVIRGWSRRADFALDDLLEMPKEPLIFPEVVQPLLSSPNVSPSSPHVERRGKHSEPWR